MELVTIATKHPIYFKMAVSLLRSVFHWSPNTSAAITLVTDLDEQLPPDLADRVRIVPPRKDLEGHIAKLALYDLTVASSVIFLDADSLCIKPIDSLYSKLAGNPFVVFGDSVQDGHWWCEVAATCKRFGVRSLPRFYGEFYYFERNKIVQDIFRAAITLAADYDKLGFHRNRGHCNEELLFSITMAQAGLNVQPLPSPITNPDRDGFISKLNSRRGSIRVLKSGELSIQSGPNGPSVVHFFASGSNLSPVYRREMFRINMCAHAVPGFVVDALASFLYVSLRLLTLFRRLRSYLPTLKPGR